MTNFEKIKKRLNEMDEADFAEWLDENLQWGDARCVFFCAEEYAMCEEECARHICEWLKQEVGEDD